jgi:hypothetical protein
VSSEVLLISPDHGVFWPLLICPPSPSPCEGHYGWQQIFYSRLDRGLRPVLPRLQRVASTNAPSPPSTATDPANNKSPSMSLHSLPAGGSPAFATTPCRPHPLGYGGSRATGVPHLGRRGPARHKVVAARQGILGARGLSHAPLHGTFRIPGTYSGFRECSWAYRGHAGRREDVRWRVGESWYFLSFA